MARRVGLRARLRYWFDNTMSKGTASLIGWLAVVSVGLITVVAGLTLWLAPAEPDGVGGQPTCHEAKRLRRSLVKPLLVVNKAYEGAFACHPRQQAEGGQTHEKPVWLRARRQAKRSAQRVALRHGQTLRTIQQRRAKLV